MEEAGKLRIPFTTGILIGIGETWEERIDSLFAIRDLHQRYGHIQEVIVQNFRAKPDIPMRDHPNASYDDMLKTIAVARLIFGGDMNIQAPPNLTRKNMNFILMRESMTGAGFSADARFHQPGGTLAGIANVEAKKRRGWFRSQGAFADLP